MENKTLLIVIVLIALAVAGWFFYQPSATEVLPSSDNGAAASECREDVLAAQDESLDKVCTAQFKELRCPNDASFTYGAPNGCEISYLEGEGWTAVEDFSEGGTENGAAEGAE